MTTALKGNTTEARVLAALVERDLAVLVPFGEGHPYDLVIHLVSDRFLRVQCKTARIHNQCVLFNSRSTDHGSGAGSYFGLADLFGVYCASTDSVYLVPVLDVPPSNAFLRLKPPRNNQRKAVRFAADFHIDRWSAYALLRAWEKARTSSGPRPMAA